MSEPTVSVVVPSYNHEHYVMEAVSSALDSYADLEVIVVDDGSTDRSVELLAACGDPRLQLHTQENQGAHVAFNRGLERARGEIVFLLNSDDSFAPKRIPRLVQMFEEHSDLVLVATWLEVVGAEGERLAIKEGFHNLAPWPRLTSGDGLADLEDPKLALLETNYVATTSNVAFRRHVIEGGLRFQPLRYTHDWEFLLAASLLGRFALVPEPLVRYRVHGRNTISEGQEDRGQATMRFEILWSLARHFEATLQERAEALGILDEDLRARAARSMPTFGAGEVLEQLLWIRSPTPQVPPAFDRLIEIGHPWREFAIRTLMAASGRNNT